jgi:hypothetical protein
MTKEQTNTRMGIEIRGTYDGCLFWYFPDTNTTEMRFDAKWYSDRKIDIQTIMDQWTKIKVMPQTPEISK